MTYFILHILHYSYFRSLKKYSLFIKIFLIQGIFLLSKQYLEKLFFIKDDISKANKKCMLDEI